MKAGLAISISIISYANHLKISCNFHEQEQEQELPSTAGMVHSQHCMQEQEQESLMKLTIRKKDETFAPILFQISLKAGLSCFRSSLSSGRYNMQPDFRGIKENLKELSLDLSSTIYKRSLHFTSKSSSNLSQKNQHLFISSEAN